MKPKNLILRRGVNFKMPQKVFLFSDKKAFFFSDFILEKSENYEIFDDSNMII